MSAALVSGARTSAPGLLDPFAALLFAYLFANDRRTQQLEALEAYTDRLYDSPEKRIGSPWLFGGWAGLAWLTEHVARVVPETTDGDESDDVYEGIDDCLVRAVETPEAPTELLHGTAGIALAWLERAAEGSVPQNLERLAILADESARAVAAGRAWLTPGSVIPRWQCAPNGYYNLGVAHGAAGTCVMLSRIAAAGIARERTEKLVADVVAWMLAQHEEGAPPWAFPSWVDPHAPQATERPFRWCYGGLGIGASLLTASRCLENVDWERAAVDILASAASMRMEDHVGIRDPSLCHGAAGNAHVFNRAYQSTGDERLADAARYWFGVLLGMRQEGKGMGGYLALVPDFTKPFDRSSPTPPPNEWLGVPDWLEGASGVGLALLAGISSTPPEWDRLLAISS